jgi:hypothetical protein
MNQKINENFAMHISKSENIEFLIKLAEKIKEEYSRVRSSIIYKQVFNCAESGHLANTFAKDLEEEIMQYDTEAICAPLVSLRKRTVNMAIGYQAFAMLIHKKELPVNQIYDILGTLLK